MASFPDPRSRHPFHMHDMIRRQPEFVQEAANRVRQSDFGSSLVRARHLILTGCGTSFHAAMYGARILQMALDPSCIVQAIPAYDLAFGPLPPGKPTVLGVSHSGSTPTTNRALSRTGRRGWRTLGVCGLPDTELGRIVDDVLEIGSTHDRSWANTMSYTAQLIAFGTLAAEVRRDWSAVHRGIHSMPTALRKALGTERALRSLSRRVARKERVTYLGTGWDDITSLEGALKIRETCGLTASAFHAEQFLHGPFLSIDRHDPIVFLRSKEDGARADAIRGALAKSGADVSFVGEHARTSIRLPRVHPYLRPVVSAIPIQFIAYYAALARHANPDVMRTDIPRLRAGVGALFH